VISIKQQPFGSGEVPMQIPNHLKSYSPQKMLSTTINEGPLTEEASTFVK